MNMFWGMNIVLIFYGGRCKTGLFFLGGGGISIFLWSLLKVKVKDGNIFGGLLKLKIPLGYACCS